MTSALTVVPENRVDPSRCLSSFTWLRSCRLGQESDWSDSGGGVLVSRDVRETSLTLVAISP